MIASRVPAGRGVNRLTRTLARLRAAGVDVIDLTASNPTRVGLPYPPDLLEALASREALVYDPAPRGLPAARRAVAAWLDARPTDLRSADDGGADDTLRAPGPAADSDPDAPAPTVFADRAAAAAAPPATDPDRVVLTASTSEAYACLFTLLCDPGDQVLLPRPSYPLLEHLARFAGVEAVPYPLVHHGVWSIDLAALRAAAGPRTRAVVVVNPNNPTGSALAPDDHAALTAFCRARGLPLIVDEVFQGYPIDPAPGRGGSVRARPAAVPTFVLGGLSKAVGLPQVKLGWIVADGPAAEVEPALAALDLVLDTYLSVSTPVQRAAAQLLAAGAPVAAAIRARAAANHRTVRRLAAACPPVTPLRVEGGWHAVIRVPATAPEDTLALDLLERDHVLVHPGYFFDFPHEAFLVASLLPAPDRFETAMARVLARAGG